MGHRRVGNDQLFKKKKTRKEKQKRKTKQRTERVRVLIACEGEKTEPNYFKSFIEDKKLSAGSLVIAKHKHNTPGGVLGDILNHLKKDSEFEYKWIVVDRDENGHTLEDFNNALSNAKKKKIGVAYSNPSFEIWYLIHFNYYQNALHRDDVIKQLKKYLPEYKKNSRNIYEKLINRQNNAIENAKKLLKNYQNTNQLNPAKNNPSTTVYKLIELLNNLNNGVK